MNRLVVVSNRVPDVAAGAQAGGLAVALESLMRRRGGLWFGWSGAVSEAAATAAPVLRHAGGVDYATVDLTAAEHAGYYNGFSNSVLWPLFHSLPHLMSIERGHAEQYRAVNARLARTLADLLRPNDLVWVHDYHLLAMPAALRAQGVRAPIGFFLHVPFPAPEMLNSAPAAAALLRDLLHADLIGFQTDSDLANFALAAQRLAGAVPGSIPGVAPGRETDGVPGLLMVAGRPVRLGVFPVEIEAPEFATLAARSWRGQATERLRRSLQGQHLILGVDRLDPTKGLVQRLAGYRRLLQTHPEWHRRATMLQIAAVSRQEVASYRDLRTAVDRAAGAINSEWGEPDWTPLRLIARAGARTTIAGYMREAKVALVTPLRDGMNLVAKEYVAAQNPHDPGVLVLSRFAGAARQLSGALLVNPNDPDEVAEAMHRALDMAPAERQARWTTMWEAIADRSALAWGRGFMAALLRAGSAAMLAAAPRPPARKPAAAQAARGQAAPQPSIGAPAIGATGTPLAPRSPITLPDRPDFTPAPSPGPALRDVGPRRLI